MLWAFLTLRVCFFFVWRVFVCEPLFKAYCTSYGRNLHTHSRIHWIMGKGDIICGDNVTFGGKVDIFFAVRFSDRPRLEVGNNSAIGHGCRFAIGKSVTIGNDCTLSGNITIMDSNAHPVDPIGRLEKRPLLPEDVRPVNISDNVWIGRDCIVFPGVRIGKGSVVSAGSVVRTHVPPYSVVAGNPAKVMFRLQRPVEGQKPEQRTGESRGENYVGGI
jgi:acetyltransferase-like isoleucine patch superfamily enzyme